MPTPTDLEGAHPWDVPLPLHGETCGATLRNGERCKAPPMRNGRCHAHGGRSTGPRDAEAHADAMRAHHEARRIERAVKAQAAADGRLEPEIIAERLLRQLHGQLALIEAGEELATPRTLSAIAMALKRIEALKPKNPAPAEDTRTTNELRTDLARRINALRGQPACPQTSSPGPSDLASLDPSQLEELIRQAQAALSERQQRARQPPSSSHDPNPHPTQPRLSLIPNSQ